MKIGVKVPRGRSKRYANFYFKKSELHVESKHSSNR